MSAVFHPWLETEKIQPLSYLTEKKPKNNPKTISTQISVSKKEEIEFLFVTVKYSAVRAKVIFKECWACSLVSVPENVSVRNHLTVPFFLIFFCCFFFFHSVALW